MTLIFSLLLSMFAHASASKPVAITHPNINGLYAIVQASTPMPLSTQKALTTSYIDGVTLRASWADVEPTQGTFNWSYLDSQLAIVKANNKKAVISVIAGSLTPSWVYSSGVRKFTTVVQQISNQNFCSPVTIPVPFDDTYVKTFNSLVTAFGAHYASNPSIAAVKFTGINYDTEETLLPHNPGSVVTARSGAQCTVPNENAIWQGLGYSASVMDAAFQSILNTFKTSFPLIPVEIMTGSGYFPTVGTASKDLAVVDFFNLGNAALGPLFVGQNNGLSATWLDPKVKAFSATNPTGYQEGSPITNNLYCAMAGSLTQSCGTVSGQQAIMQGALNMGINAKALYLEIYPGDVSNSAFMAMLTTAHASLVK